MSLRPSVLPPLNRAAHIKGEGVVFFVSATVIVTLSLTPSVRSGGQAVKSFTHSSAGAEIVFAPQFIANGDRERVLPEDFGQFYRSSSPRSAAPPSYIKEYLYPSRTPNPHPLSLLISVRSASIKSTFNECNLQVATCLAQSASSL